SSRHSCSSAACSFFSSFYAPHRHLHSFPTRRSSDLQFAHGLWPCLDQHLPDEAGAKLGDRQGPHFPRRVLRTDAEAFEAVKELEDRKSTRLNSSHVKISYAVFCLKKKRE